MVLSDPSSGSEIQPVLPAAETVRETEGNDSPREHTVFWATVSALLAGVTLFRMALMSSGS